VTSRTPGFAEAPSVEFVNGFLSLNAGSLRRIRRVPALLYDTVHIYE
jgi:hypothetical protein